MRRERKKMRWKTSAKILGMCICFALAETARRLTFIAPDWRGGITADKLLSGIFFFGFLAFFGCACYLLKEVYEDFTSGPSYQAILVRLRRLGWIEEEPE
jgi:hypothetical protein